MFDAIAQRATVENSAKERLTGAVILVALVVLVVPELLSGPGRSPSQPSEASGEPPMRSYTVQLNDVPGGAATMPSGGAAAPFGPATMPSGPATVPSGVPSEPPSASSRAVPPGVPAAPSSAVPLGAPAGPSSVVPRASAAPSAAAVRSAARSAAAPVRPAAAAARSAAAVVPSRAASKKAERPAAASTEAGWQVQVGSFGSREHADRLVHELKSKGFGASVSESESHGRKWYRVRVGPEQDRAAALAVAHRLRATGETPVVQPP